jgi:hypothetical protein
MPIDISSVLREAIEQFGTYMSVEVLGQRWHTAPETVGQIIKDGKGPGLAISPEGGNRTKYIIPTISVIIYEINAGQPQKKQSETA